MATIANLAVSLTANNTRFNRGIRGASRTLHGFRGVVNLTTAALGRMAAYFLGGAGILAGVVAMKRMVSVGASFEHSMARVRALTQATGAEFGNLSRIAKELGITTIFTASQAAEAMAVFALAGFKVDKIMKSMKPTLDMAAAGQMNVADAADMAVRIMAGMGIGAERLGEAVDVMAKAFTTANTDLRMLGEALSYVGPISASLKRPFEETAAAVQILSNAGIRAERAGTTLRMAFLRMANPAKEAQKLMRQLGITFVDAAGEMRPLADVVDNLNRATAGMGEGAKLGVMAQIFPARAASGMVKLLSASGDQLRKLEDALANAGGTAERVATTQLDTLTGSWIKFKSAMQGLGIEIFEAIKPMLRGIVDFSTGGARALARFVAATRDRLKALSPVILPVLRSIGGAAKAFFGTIWNGAKNAFAWIGEKLEWLGDRFGGWGNIVKAVAMEVTRAFIVLEWNFKRWKEVAALVFLGAELAVVQWANQVKYFFVEVIPAYARWFRDNWRDIMTDMWELTKTVWTNLGDNIVRIIKNLPGLITGEVDFADLWVNLAEGFESSLRELPEIAEREIGGLERTLTDAFDSLNRSLAADQQAFVEQRMDELWGGFGERAEAETQRVEEMVQKAAGAAAGIGGMIEQRFAPAAIKGSVEAYRTVIEDSARRPRAERDIAETATNTARTAENTERMVSVLSNAASGPISLAEASL